MALTMFAAISFTIRGTASLYWMFVIAGVACNIVVVPRAWRLWRETHERNSEGPQP
ncbi:hypothetical protein P3102_10995 [Amycolatopsis sp. QT-25]|uniref:hypothetical protein n=1 Tax=Amycolatopsis sp. QT-25 TaxID=3034022 RepID=UPI0023EDA60C|nr:hypothetical protein [Amycolatopsis sp. QT-25]WET81688.1 hypothetical protein P3102_10995 [Amycolatopsis sp. QT-25]